MKLTLCTPCLFGLESILAGEARRMGGEDIHTMDGRVTFTGDEALLARANLGLRTAERVCIVLGTFQAHTFTELFDQTAGLPFEQFIGKNDAFPVKGWSLKSTLHSIPDCQSIIKKAAVTRLQNAYGLNWFAETGTVHQIRFAIHKDEVMVMLDSSGTGLHKRGYRAASTEAPIKETLAAGIVDLARVRGDTIAVDPMCGSGTLLIEAALKAYHIAPGLRRKFAAEQWDALPSRIWQDERSRAMEAIRRDASFRALGFDADALAVGLTQQNAAKAGIGKKITAAMQDISALSMDALPACSGKYGGVVLCNPPYGERLLELQEAEALYRTMGRVMARHPEWSYYIISPHEQFEKLFGRPADKRRKLYNGMIRCQLYMYYAK